MDVRLAKPPVPRGLVRHYANIVLRSKPFEGLLVTEEISQVIINRYVLMFLLCPPSPPNFNVVQDVTSAGLRGAFDRSKFRKCPNHVNIEIGG